MLAAPSVCERCKRPWIGGKRYTFRYGRKGPESRHYEGALRVRTRYYSFAGEKSAWICNRCVTPRQVLYDVSISIMPIFVLISPFLGIWQGNTNKIGWGLIGLGLVGYLVWYLVKFPNDMGEKLAIGMYRKELKAAGYNLFTTTFAYNSIKKQAS